MTWEASNTEPHSRGLPALHPVGVQLPPALSGLIQAGLGGAQPDVRGGLQGWELPCGWGGGSLGARTRSPS